MSKVHWVALATAARVGGKTITRLLGHFGTLEAVFEATPDELMQVPHVGRQTANAIARIDLGAVEADLEGLSQIGIQVLTWGDTAFPSNLLRCEDAPPVLFVRGALLPADAQAVAVVGTRTPSPKSAKLASQLAFELASRGWTIVSGLALGIDGAAHQGALESGGRTLAVLGSGIERIYPPQHAHLAQAIEERGAVLSELHPNVAVSPQNLIARNRITSGLSRAVIVVQSGQDSGSVSTARRAWRQGRKVFAVTGGDAGCDTLLQAGAEAIHPDQMEWEALSRALAGCEG
jgi:DNA processing protein